MKDEILIHKIGLLLQKWNVTKQVIITTPSSDHCKLAKNTIEEVETLIWFHSQEATLEEEYHKAIENPFIDGVLFVLDQGEKSPFQLSNQFLQEALQASAHKPYSLALFYPEFQKENITSLLDLGFFRFATDKIDRFLNIINL